MNMINSGDTKLSPLIHFDCIIDSDYGITELINQEYLDPNVFDIEFFKKPRLEKLKLLYSRKDLNPLTVFSSLDKKDLDEIYKEFMDERYYDILNNSVSTEIVNLMNIFEDVGDIKSTILVDNEIQERIIKETEFLRKYKVLFSKDSSSRYIFNCAYFKKIEDISTLNDINITTYYISTFGSNLTEDNQDIKASDTIDLIAKRRYNIHLIDLYKWRN